MNSWNPEIVGLEIRRVKDKVNSHRWQLTGKGIAKSVSAINECIFKSGGDFMIGIGHGSIIEISADNYRIWTFGKACSDPSWQGFNQYSTK